MTRIDHRVRPMVFVRLDCGCEVCLSHQLNRDGYLRRSWGSSSMGRRTAEMFHRFIYRARKGELEQGEEVDHVCRNRACCNPYHLQARRKADHAALTNRTRYAARKAGAKVFWLAHKVTGATLAKACGVTWSAACRWIKEWRNDTH